MPAPLLGWLGYAVATTFVAAVAYVAKEYISDDKSSYESDKVDENVIKQQAYAYALSQAQALALEFGANRAEIDKRFFDDDAQGFPVLNQKKFCRFLLAHSTEYRQIKEHLGKLSYYIDAL